MKTLIVEDDEGTRLFLQTILQSRQHEVADFGAAEPAWARYEQEFFPLVIIDWGLPGMDGLELCRKMRESRGDSSMILVFTGRNEPESLHSVLAAGADDYLAKPLDPPNLLIRIEIAERRARAKVERMKADLLLQRAQEDLERRVVERTAELSSINTKLQTEVSDRHRAERWLSGILEAAADGILVIDQEARIQLVNGQIVQMFGYPADELLGQSVEMLLPDDKHSSSHEKVARFFEHWTDDVGNTVKGLTLRGCRRDGSEFAAEISVSTFLGEVGSAAVAIIRDVTERRRAADELQRAKEIAEAANRAKSEFLANMSHEIRTPLNGIIGMTALSLETKLTPEQRDYLETIKVSTDSLLTVINDILDFSKVEARKLELEAIEFRLRDMIGDAIELLALRAHEKGVELVSHVHCDVPDLWIGDPVRLRQVVVNLVGNAIKFTERGEVAIEVTRDADDVQRLHFVVVDTGIGIPEEKQADIFNAFTQADGSMTRRFGGTGLGLAISAQLVGMMGGKIWVTSRPNMGSSFHFTVNLAVAPKQPALPELPAAVRGMAVLAADDSRANRKFLEDLLKSWGLRPTVASGGPAALAAITAADAARQPFGMFLIDGQMPRMDGLSLIEQIQRPPRAARPVVLMIHPGELPEESARSLGVAACVSKPVRESALAESIGRAFGIVNTDAPEPESPAPPASRRKLCILLAEDNPINQKLAIRMLEKQGHEVILAQNGMEAVQLLDEHDFDLALMDVQMPEMDGLQATAIIREREIESQKHLIIIAMTAYALKGDRERCMAAGMDGYISKPVQPKALFELMDALLASRDVRNAVNSASESIDSVIDRQQFMERVEGDTELMRDLAGIFVEDCPNMVGRIEVALKAKDASALRGSAHALKGSIGVFGATAAHTAALRLEEIGRSGDLVHAEEAYSILRDEVRRLNLALLELLKETAENA